MAEYVICAAVSIVCSTAVRILCSRPCDYASGKLKDGDLANEQLRRIIVRDLNDIKTKLDCLALKDLNCSYSFLKEGVRLLNLVFGKANEDQTTNQGPNETTAVAISLPREIQVLNTSSVVKERLRAAKDCFKTAREEATRAFNNKSLSIKDRIMACKLRVAARIFESGREDPEAAVSACLFALEELHGLAAIKDMFKVFLSGGMRSRLHKAGRLENIMSVVFINHGLFHFAAKYNSKYPNVFTWPKIELADRTLHPILHAYDIVTKTSSGEEFRQRLNRLIVSERTYRNHSWYFAVNSRGEIILLDDNKITVIYSSGESKDVMFSDSSESDVVERGRRAVAVDCDDNVYVARYLKTRDEKGEKENFVLCVLDENFNIKHDPIFLDFLTAGKRVKIAVDKNKNIIMITTADNQVYVCDNTGRKKFKFERDGDGLSNIGITDKNDIMVRSDDESAVYVYTTEGDLKSTIKVPEDHKVMQVAFHHGLCRIIVLTYDRKQGSLAVLCFSETGKLEQSERDIHGCSGITSHPSGTFAVLQFESITLI